MLNIVLFYDAKKKPTYAGLKHKWKFFTRHKYEIILKVCNFKTILQSL